jgi:hypothetical protein
LVSAEGSIWQIVEVLCQCLVIVARIQPWLLRALWASLPFAVGVDVAAGLSDRSRPVQLTGSSASWMAWAVVLVATLVPHPVSLTAIRMAAPACVVLDVSTRPSVIGLLASGALLATVFAPATGALFVNGPAYPNERRFPLRAPGPLLIGLIAVAWAIAVGPVAVGALLIAARRWVAGGVLAGLGLPVAWLFVRALHGLSRRWLVFVPAGVVLHDPVSLADPVLFQRRQIAALRPALAGTDSLDLTQRSPGLTLELVLTEKVPMVLVTPGHRAGEPGASARLLFTPTRPGALLAEAARRRLPR